MVNFFPQKSSVSSLSRYLFLLGCAALPFFQDFPLFTFIHRSLSDLPTLFFLLSGLVVFVEYLFLNQNSKLTRTDISFVAIVIIFVWSSFFANLDTFGEVCGENICGKERMLSAGTSLTIKLLVLLTFIRNIKLEGVERVAKYIRLGFYFSATYVFIEIFFAIIPINFDIYSSRFFDRLEHFFHIRDSLYGLNRTRGLANEPSFQAVFLITCLPFLLADKNEKNRYRNKVIWAICMISTFSLTGIVATFAFLVTYKYSLKRIFCTQVPVAIFLLWTALHLGYLDINPLDFPSIILRIGSWVAAFHSIMDHIAIGVGPGMAGYSVTQYYPDFFYLSYEAPNFYELGQLHFDAGTFASLLTFTTEYGLVVIFLAVACLEQKRLIKSAFASRLGRASLVSLFVASFGISSPQLWGYFLFLALILTRSWGQLSELSNAHKAA